MSLFRSSYVALAIAVLAVVLVPGCKATPSQRPVELGPVDTGPGSLAGVRKQLEGTWILVSVETDPGTEKAALLKATGQLRYDAYSNLTMDGKILESQGAGSAPDVSRHLVLSGRAVIDPATSRLWVVEAGSDPASGAAPQSGAALPPPVSADKVRYYEFSGDLLTTLVKDADGRVTAKVTWKKSAQAP